MGQTKQPEKPVERILTVEDFHSIRPYTEAIEYGAGDLVVVEGDDADYVYFVESGRVSVYLQKFTERQELCVLSPGDYFGEMAMLDNIKRSASVMALEKAVILRAGRADFERLMEQHAAIRNNVMKVYDQRSSKAAIQELLQDSAEAGSEARTLSIKGDPSLRESAFTRERYDSVVDKLIVQLCPQIEELLLNRCVYSVFIHFNSGEIGTTSIFDPFCEVVHAAYKLTDPGYINRQFVPIDYDDKLAFINGVYAHIAQTQQRLAMPEKFVALQGHLSSYQDALTREEVKTTVSKLPLLRRIPNFFIRNIRINMVRHAIRMQFNCDGTHFVSASDYLRFLEENVVEE